METNRFSLFFFHAHRFCGQVFASTDLARIGAYPVVFRPDVNLVSEGVGGFASYLVLADECLHPPCFEFCNHHASFLQLARLPSNKIFPKQLPVVVLKIFLLDISLLVK